MPVAVNAQTHDLLEGRRVILSDSLFKSGSAEVISSKAVYLDSIGSMMSRTAELAVEIDGFADNQGKEKANVLLSEGRAQGVKKYLSSKFGIVPERMSTKGFGSTSPIGDNGTVEGRAKNRRVEIVPVTPLTKRPVISVYNVPINAEGKISFLEREVSTKPPWSPLFSDAYLNQPVYELHKIHTLSDSRTVVTFNDLSEMKIGDNTMIVIYGTPLSEVRAERKENISLMTGGLLTKLRSLSPGRKFIVKTPSASITMNQNTNSKLGVDSSDRSMVSVFEGNAEVGAQDTSVSVPRGFGTDVKKGAPPTPPRPLPRIPDRVFPLRDSTVSAGSGIAFTWKSATRKVRFEIAPDTSFNSILATNLVEGTTVNVPLSLGDYYYRFTAVADDGLESPPNSPYHLTVVAASKAFLHVNRPKDTLIVVDSSAYTIAGEVERDAWISINGRSLETLPDGTFREHVDLVEGDNRFTIHVVDGKGGETSASYVIHKAEPAATVKVSAGVSPVIALGTLESFKPGIIYSFSIAYIWTPAFNTGISIGLGQATAKSSALSPVPDADINMFEGYGEYLFWQNGRWDLAVNAGLGSIRWVMAGVGGTAQMEKYAFSYSLGGAVKYNVDRVALSLGAKYIGIAGDEHGFDPASSSKTHSMIAVSLGLEVFLK